MPDVFDEAGLVRPACQIPKEVSRPQRRQLVEAPPLPAWKFDEGKLRQLLEAARQASLVRRDHSERLMEARSKLSNLRSRVAADAAGYDSASPSLQHSLELAINEVARLADEQVDLDERANGALSIAHSCEQWAREVHHWTPDGQPPGVSLVPGVVGSE